MNAIIVLCCVLNITLIKFAVSTLNKLPLAFIMRNIK